MGADDRAQRDRLEHAQTECRRLRALLADPEWPARLAREVDAEHQRALEAHAALSAERELLDQRIEQLRLDSMAARRRRAERDATRATVRALAFLGTLSTGLGAAIALARYAGPLPALLLGAIASVSATVAAVETFRLGARVRGAIRPAQPRELNDAPSAGRSRTRT